MKNAKLGVPSLIYFALVGLLATQMIVGASATGQEGPARPALVAPAELVAASDGVLRQRSNHSFDETVARIEAAVLAKGVRLFTTVNHKDVAAQANISLGKSTLILFGDPGLGPQFLQANRYAGLDWPVRMLVVEEADGSVWLAWNDFGYIARRHGITSRDEQFATATRVSGAIAAEAAR
ncbi:DUF302 domain-containing protein [Sphingomonas sp.]|uniref:DUF302 domain-containing protein n=1 Tax=Sphingomonas sp. TaxID=28214 RepID=UPI0035A9606C